MINKAILICLLGLLFFVQGKVFDQNLNVHHLRKNQGWNYIGRMTVDPGSFLFTLQLHLKFPQLTSTPNYVVQVAAIPNQFWEQQVKNKCNISNYDPEILKLKQKKQIVITAVLNKQTSYHTVSSLARNLDNEQTYYFVLRNCGQSLLKEGFGRKSKLQIELEVKSNSKHTTSQDDYFNWLLPLILVLQVGLLVILVRDHQEDGDNWSKYLLKISLIVGIVSMIFRYSGHAIYAHFTGYFYQFFDVLYLLFHAISDYIVMFLLVLLSFGWTVKFVKRFDMDLFIPLGCMLGFVHIILVVMNKISDGEHDKYHMFDSIPAYIMMAFRIIALGVFIFGTLSSILHLKADQTKIRHYFIHLLTLGFLYLAFVPIAFMLINFIQAEQRQEIMFIGIEFCKLALNAWLAYLSGNKVSAYRQVLDASFMEKDEKYF